VLRAFELLLLREAGYLPALDEEGASLQPLQPQDLYRLVPESGLQSVRHVQDSGSPGAQWLALQQALDSEQPFVALLQALQSEVEERGPMRQQLRTLLHYHSGVRVFQTRQLMVDAQRLGAR
jgi:DNA repair protein RecO (recombination protein O)